MSDGFDLKESARGIEERHVGPGQWVGIADDCIRLATKAADARAEEIAVGFELSGPNTPIESCSEAAAFARSFISKPPEPKECDLGSPWKNPMRVHQSGQNVDEAAIRADERENVVKALDAFRDAAGRSGQHTLINGITAARQVVTHMDEQQTPKTREQVLEEALREIGRHPRAGCQRKAWEYRGADCVCSACIARRALEWTP